MEGGDRDTLLRHLQDMEQCDSAHVTCCSLALPSLVLSPSNICGLVPPAPFTVPPRWPLTGQKVLSTLALSLLPVLTATVFSL